MDLGDWLTSAWASVLGLLWSLGTLIAAWPHTSLAFALFAAFAGSVLLSRRKPPASRRPKVPTRQSDQLSKIQRSRDSRVIAIIHREASLSGLAFHEPGRSYIDLNDFEGVLSAIGTTNPDRPLDIILHTEGGETLAALQIARAVKAHKGRKTVFVPYFAMSGGTLIALAADEIVMSEHAVLGPIDPQIGGLPAASIMKVVREKPIASVNDFTVIQADIAQKAMDQMRRQACELMAGTYNEDGSCSISNELASGKWTHSYPITVPEARELGLNVSTNMPQEVVDLIALYPGPMQRDPNVQYLPGIDGRG